MGIAIRIQNVNFQNTGIGVVNLLKCKSPVSSVNSGYYTDEQVITLTSETEDSDIYYTIDGTTPDLRSIKYENSFTISQDTVIKAICIKKDYVNSNVSIFDIKFGIEPTYQFSFKDNTQEINNKCVIDDQASFNYTLTDNGLSIGREVGNLLFVQDQVTTRSVNAVAFEYKYNNITPPKDYMYLLTIASETPQYKQITSLNGMVGNRGSNYAIFYRTSTKHIGITSSAGDLEFNSTINLFDGQNHKICMIFSNNIQTAQLYVDGKYIGSLNNGHTVTNPYNNNVGLICIGNNWRSYVINISDRLPSRTGPGYYKNLKIYCGDKTITAQDAISLTK